MHSNEADGDSLEGQGPFFNVSECEASISNMLDVGSERVKCFQAEVLPHLIKFFVFRLGG